MKKIKIKKKRQQHGVYNPQAKEMSDFDNSNRKKIDISTITVEVQPERLI